MIFYNKTKLSSILAYYILLYPNITFYKSITEYTYFLKKITVGILILVRKYNAISEIDF